MYIKVQWKIVCEERNEKLHKLVKWVSRTLVLTPAERNEYNRYREKEEKLS
jgi:hypothetical protein